MANITAEDPDDEGLPGHLLYSITTISSYFVIDQCESSQHPIPHLLMHPLEWFWKAFFLSGTWPAFLSRLSLSCQGKDVLKATDTSRDCGACTGLIVSRESLDTFMEEVNFFLTATKVKYK